MEPTETPAPLARRDPKTGRYLAGASGNPGGRPKDTPDVGEMARTAAGLALFTLMRVCNDRVAPPHVQMRAAEYLLRRGFGMPPIGDPGGVARWPGLRDAVLRCLDAHVREVGTIAVRGPHDPA